MNVQKYWTQLLAAFGDVTGARNLDQFQKKHIAAVSPAAKAETVTTTNVITAAESGKTFFLGTAGGFASTLPAPAAGLNYKFIVSVAPTTAYTIATNGSANIIKGGVNELEVDTGDDGPYSAVGDLISFVANVAVVGDWVSVESDGTSWFLTGQTNADGGVTIGST
jgi:hypothetical protein